MWEAADVKGGYRQPSVAKEEMWCSGPDLLITQGEVTEGVKKRNVGKAIRVDEMRPE